MKQHHIEKTERIAAFVREEEELKERYRTQRLRFSEALDLLGSWLKQHDIELDRVHFHFSNEVKSASAVFILKDDEALRRYVCCRTRFWDLVVREMHLSTEVIDDLKSQPLAPLDFVAVDYPGWALHVPINLESGEYPPAEFFTRTETLECERDTLEQELDQEVRLHEMKAWAAHSAPAS